ncbi:MAG: hypothetical protein ABR562_01955 [Thermoplasmatota archaeon]
MHPGRLEEKFLKQARRGPAWWRVQRQLSLGVVALLALAGAYSLWAAWADGGEGILGVLLWLGLAGGAGIWHIHAELMEGAAFYIARASDKPVSEALGPVR